MHQFSQVNNIHFNLVKNMEYAGYEDNGYKTKAVAAIGGGIFGILSEFCRGGMIVQKSRENQS